MSTCYQYECDNDVGKVHFPTFCQDCRDIHARMCELPVIRNVSNSVRSIRGLGDSGKKVDIVEYECSSCGYDRMTRIKHIYPESPSGIELECRYCQKIEEY